MTTYTIELEGSGQIEIKWPDGSVDKGALPLSAGREFDSGSGKQILITGDVQDITVFRAFGYNTGITEIAGLKHLRKLETFLPGALMRLSARLDLHHNRMLETVDLFEVSLPEWLNLPEQHYIDSFTLTMGDRLVTSNEIDMLIDNIYKNAVRRNIIGGMVHLTGSDSPSVQALTKIQALEEKYGWDINLNL
jgi:hypothetical protein